MNDTPLPPHKQLPAWIAKGGTEEQFRELKDSLPQDLFGPPNIAEFLVSEPRNIVRLKTGFPTLDTATREGIPTGIVTSILGAPHTGKTAIGSQIALEAARQGYLVVCLFKDEGRFAACVRLGQQLGLNRGRLENREDFEIVSLTKAIASIHLLVPDPDSPDWTLEKTIAWAEANSDGRPWLFMIDSIQNVYINEIIEEARKDIAAKMRIIEDAAKRGAWVFSISEMSRAAYRHKDAKDNINAMASGAESRAIEYGSRLILSLEGDTNDVVTANIIKNSPGGRRVPVHLRFDPDQAIFREITEGEAEAFREVVSAETANKTSLKLEKRIMEALASGPMNTGTLRKAVRGDATKSDAVRDEMCLDGKIIKVDGTGNAILYSLPRTPSQK